MEVTFEVIGNPKGKGRPRFARRGNFISTYTPKETVAYEKLVRDSYLDQVGEVMLDGAIEMDITAYFPIPKSTPKKRAELMRTGKIYHTKHKDVDNICKSVMDAIIGIAYEDDKQVCVLHAEKLYGDPPKVEVTIKELANEKEA